MDIRALIREEVLAQAAYPVERAPEQREGPCLRSSVTIEH